MENAHACGKISTVRNGWIICPVCRKGKLMPVRPDSVVLRIDRKCKLCGATSEVNYEAPEPASIETSA